MKKIFVLKFALLLCAHVTTSPTTTANPPSICQELSSLNSTSLQSVDASSDVKLTVPFETFLPHRITSVTLTGESSGFNTLFVRFHLQGRSVKDDQPVGSFDGVDEEIIQFVTCPSTKPVTSSNNTVTNTKAWRDNPGSIIRVGWNTSTLHENVYFVGSIKPISTPWINIQSLYISPMDWYNFTECCQRESLISNQVRSFCDLLSKQDFKGNLTALNMLDDLLISSEEHHGLFLAFRCLHWSSSSSSTNRSKLADCCSENHVSDACFSFCEADTFATIDGLHDFSSLFLNCTQENPAVASCQLNAIDDADVDECEDVECSVFATCYNTMAGFNCVCHIGFTGDGMTCYDLDECLTSESYCHPDASCQNTPGGFSCVCDVGFSGDGFTCQALATLQPPVYPREAVVYTVVVTVFGSFPNDLHNIISHSVYSQLLQPAMDSLPGYHSIRRGFIDQNTNLLISHQVVFIADIISHSPTEYNFPTLTNVTTNLQSTASSLGFSISTGSDSFNFDQNIDISHANINSSCSDANCPPPPPNYTSVCVDVGDSDFACLCVSNEGEEVHCRDAFPPPPTSTSSSPSTPPPTSTSPPMPPPASPTTQLPDNIVRYVIISVINVNPPTEQNHKNDLLNELETALLIPALSALSGYKTVRYVNDTTGSLIVTSEAEFETSTTSEGLEIPTLNMIENKLMERLKSLDNKLTAPGFPGGAPVSPNFTVSHTALNGACSTGTPCSSPSPDYYSRCVEVGSSSVVCLCVRSSDNTEVNCSTIDPGCCSNEGLSVGAIVGIAVGAFAVLCAILVTAFCLCRRRKAKEGKTNRASSQSSDSYINPEYFDTQVIDKETNEHIYMEIKTRPSLFQEGQYIDTLKPDFGLSKNVSQPIFYPPEAYPSSTGQYEEPTILISASDKKLPFPNANQDPSVQPTNEAPTSQNVDARTSLENDQLKPTIVMEEDEDGYLFSPQDETKSNEIGEKQKSQDDAYTPTTYAPTTYDFADPTSNKDGDDVDSSELKDKPSIPSAVESGYEVPFVLQAPTTDPDDVACQKSASGGMEKSEKDLEHARNDVVVKDVDVGTYIC